MSFLFDAPPIIPTHQDNQQQYTPIKPYVFYQFYAFIDKLLLHLLLIEVPL